MHWLPLVKKVERIMRDPAPFIFDDGCCCLSPCCCPVPHQIFTRQTGDQLSTDYMEIPFSVDGHGDPSFPSPRSEAHLHGGSLFEHDKEQVITSEPDRFDAPGACLYPSEPADQVLFLPV